MCLTFLKHALRLILILFTGMWVGMPVAFAGNIASAEIGAGDITGGVNGGTSAFFLYSNMKTPFVVGPNKVTEITQRSSTGVKTTIANPIPAASGTVLDFGPRTYSDIVGKNNIAKPDKPEGSQFARDRSFQVEPVGNTFIAFGVEANGQVSRTAKILFSTGVISAGASTINGASGEAAAITYDPVQLIGPSSGYFLLNYIDSDEVEHHEYPIAATLGTTNPGDFAAVEFMAIDSRFEPNPANVGDPSNYLWILMIAVEGPLTSLGDLTVSFRINPLATKAGGGTADILTDSSGNLLSPGSILSRVLGELTVADGVATLAALDPFPLGTQYHVPFGTTITYGVADGAAITAAVPEPGSAGLLLLGGLGLLGYTAPARKDYWKRWSRREIADSRSRQGNSGNSQA